MIYEIARSTRWRISAELIPPFMRSLGISDKSIAEASREMAIHHKTIERWLSHSCTLPEKYHEAVRLFTANNQG